MGQQWRQEPSLAFNLLLAVVCLLVFYTVSSFGHAIAQQMAMFGDNPGYDMIANSIRHWDFASIHAHPNVKRLFWGLPLVVAAVKSIPGLQAPGLAIVAVSLTSFFLVIYCLQHLFGGWVTALFTLCSWDWLQRVTLGGAEPLFLLGLFAGFYCLRQRRWLWAAALLSFATMVRPMGVFALLAMGLVLFYQRQYRLLFRCGLVSVLLGVGYFILVASAYGRAFAHFSTYGSQQGQFYLGVPLLGFIRSVTTVAPKLPLITNIKIAVWVLFTLINLVLLFTPRLVRPLFSRYTSELLFCCFYILFLISYTSLHWSWFAYPRFVIPILPMLWLIAVASGFINFCKERRLLLVLAIISSALAAASAMDVHRLLTAWGQYL